MKVSKKPGKVAQFISLLRPAHRFIISALLAGITLFIPHHGTGNLLWSVIAWSVFAFVFTLTGWIILYSSSLDHIKKTAKTDDGSKAFVFAMVLIASFASLFSVTILMISDHGRSEQFLFIPVVIFAMLVSWTLVHTTFTFHYAHMFYDHDEKTNKEHAGGLDFPGDTEPDYLDFAYLSFVIGCTFQVSDVVLSSKKIRRMVLFHGLLSFALNTFVVALTINLVASLK
ncbi:MAG TPA: DUF1345 domain-containing protein [Bacteroidia bacterium]|nr:DUF1345 domain-containing protein [Bacteroidia bacterium]